MGNNSMSLNKQSPTTLTSLLIAETRTEPGGSTDSIPTMTKVGAQTVDALLELQGSAALLLNRVTNTQMDDIIATNGMVVYNVDADALYVYANDAWEGIVPNNGVTRIIDTSGAGTNNLFVGSDAGNYTTTGADNVALGINTFKVNTTGHSNLAAGFEALVHNTTGHENTAIGIIALGNNATGNGNTAVGAGALVQVTGAQFNTAIGHEAGAGQVSYTQCTFLGIGADALVNNLSNATAVGANAKVSASNTMILGDDVRVGIGVLTPDPSAILHLGNDVKGFLPPVMSTVDRDTIPAPAQGLMIFDSTSGLLNVYHGGWNTLFSPAFSPTSATFTTTNNQIIGDPGPIYIKPFVGALSNVVGNITYPVAGQIHVPAGWYTFSLTVNLTSGAAATAAVAFFADGNNVYIPNAFINSDPANIIAGFLAEDNLIATFTFTAYVAGYFQICGDCSGTDWTAPTQVVSFARIA
jgi:hypothetical protein